MPGSSEQVALWASSVKVSGGRAATRDVVDPSVTFADNRCRVTHHVTADPDGKSQNAAEERHEARKLRLYVRAADPTEAYV